MTVQDLLKRINENAQLLSKGGLSDIERDILLHDLRELYTVVKGKETKEVKAPVIPPVEKPVAKEKPVIIKQEPIEIKAEVIAPPVVTIQPEVKTPIIEEKPTVVEVAAPVVEEKKTAPVADPTPVITFVETQVKATNTKPASSLNEIFAGEEKSLNEKHSSTQKSALNDQAARKDLKSLIDLNKQFVIINELFKGDGAAFQSTIDRINASPTVESAFEYLKTEVMPKYQWSGEMQSARLFDKLVRQKFGV